MAELLLLALLGAAVVAPKAWAGDALLNMSKLEMFVDELVDMPRVQGFEVADGIPRPKSLKIGMYRILWVSDTDPRNYSWLSMIFSLYTLRFANRISVFRSTSHGPSMLE